MEVTLFCLAFSFRELLRGLLLTLQVVAPPLWGLKNLEQLETGWDTFWSWKKSEPKVVKMRVILLFLQMLSVLYA